MHVLVFGDAAPMEQVIDGLRAAGHTVGLRNPRFWERGQTETCGGVVVNSMDRNAGAIANAYDAAGVAVWIVGAALICTERRDAQCLGIFDPQAIASGAPFAVTGA